MNSPRHAMYTKRHYLFGVLHFRRPLFGGKSSVRWSNSASFHGLSTAPRATLPPTPSAPELATSHGTKPGSWLRTEVKKKGWSQRGGLPGVCRGWERPTWWQKHSQHLGAEAAAGQKAVTPKLSLELISDGVRTQTAWKPVWVAMADGREHHHSVLHLYAHQTWRGEHWIAVRTQDTGHRWAVEVEEALGWPWQS